MSEFEGKVAIVTGASSGIGRTCALFYAQEGAKVIGSDINEEGGREIVRLIQDASGEAFFVTNDVANSFVNGAYYAVDGGYLTR